MKVVGVGVQTSPKAIANLLQMLCEARPLSNAANLQILQQDRQLSNANLQILQEAR